jgi:hypothetical protein
MSGTLTFLELHGDAHDSEGSVTSIGSFLFQWRLDMYPLPYGVELPPLVALLVQFRFCYVDCYSSSSNYQIKP